jgi:TRAP transporter TAXI family solute receptor
LVFQKELWYNFFVVSVFPLFCDEKHRYFTFSSDTAPPPEIEGIRLVFSSLWLCRFPALLDHKSILSYYAYRHPYGISYPKGGLEIMRKYLVATLVVLLVLGTLGVGFAAKEGWPDQLRFMAGPPGGNWFAMGGAMADLWTKEVIQTTSSTGGGVANIVNVNAAKADMGLSVTSMMGAAAKGEDPYKEVLGNAGLFANLYRQYTYFIMRKDYAEKNGIKTLGDVMEKKLPLRFATLKPGTSSEFVIKSILQKGYGVSWEDIKKWGGSVEFSNYDDGGNLLADGHLDCFAFAVGRAASVVMKIESQTDVVILPVDEPARKAMADAYGTTTFEIEPGIYKSVTEPVPVVGDYTCIVIRQDLPEDLVYELAKSLWGGKASIASAIKDLEELDPKEAISAGVPAHPGAVKFWKEAAGN